MPFQRPTLAELIDRVEGDINARVVGADSRLRRSMLSVIARIVAATAHGLYGYLDWMSRQVIPDTAEAELLDTHASWWGVTRLSSTPSAGAAVFTGIFGTDIPAGTLIQRVDGQQFSTDALATVVSGPVSVPVTSLTNGQINNTNAAVLLNLVSAVSGIDSVVTVDTGGFVGGSEIESDQSLTARLRARVQKTPHGGAVHDYVAWAKEVAGVTRAWAFGSWSGVGTVGVFIVRDDDASLIPDAGEVSAVQSYIDNLRPVTAAVTVYAPTEVAQNMTIQIAPNDSAVQAAIQSELQDLFRNTAQVEGGNGEGIILISHIREVVSIAAGETDHIMVTPTANITLNNGELATLGVITFQAIP